MKSQFLIEFLSILSWRLGFLSGELPQPQPSVSEGGVGGVRFVKITKAYVIKILRASARMLINFYDLQVPISNQI